MPAPAVTANQRDAREVLRIGVAVALLLACGGGATEPRDHNDRYPRGRITLTHLPVDPHRVIGLIPLGNLNVLPEDHGAFVTPRAGWYGAPTIPVYAPAKGTIVNINPDWYPFFAPHGHDIAITIKVSTTMVISYAHMSDLTPEIWAAAGNLQTGYAVPNAVSIDVEAGQVVGYIGTQGSLDWYIGDSELQLNFVNPSRYPLPWLISGCYHDYYQEPLRGQLLAITLRNGTPPCGRIDFDVAGRIAGNWFLEGQVPANAFSDYSTHLAIVYDEFEGANVAISDGIAIRPSSPHEGDDRWNASRVFWVEGNGPKPETVGMTQGLVKYEIMDRPPINLDPPEPGPPYVPTVVGVMLVEMVAPARIRVERVMGKRAHEVSGFGANARFYVR